MSDTPKPASPMLAASKYNAALTKLDEIAQLVLSLALADLTHPELPAAVARYKAIAQRLELARQGLIDKHPILAQALKAPRHL